MGDAGPGSPSSADKRRNKLGYQRIAVACSHCRRRKIRCALAQGDAQGRCTNCIRLKKECVFLPVDSPSAEDSRAGSKPRLSSQTSSAASHSPSTMDRDARDGTERDLRQYSLATSSNIQHESHAHMEPPSLMSGAVSGPGLPSNFTYGLPALIQQPMSRAEWEPGHLQSTSSNREDTRDGTQWRLPESPAMSNFVGYSNAMQSGISQPSYPYYPTRDMTSYPQPLRSSSYDEMGHPPQHASQHFSSPLLGPSAQAPSYHPSYATEGTKMSHNQSHSQYLQQGPPQMMPYGMHPDQHWAQYPSQQSQTGSPRHDSMHQTTWPQPVPSMQSVDVAQQQQQHYQQHQQMQSGSSNMYKRPPS